MQQWMQKYWVFVLVVLAFGLAQVYTRSPKNDDFEKANAVMGGPPVNDGALGEVNKNNRQMIEDQKEVQGEEDPNPGYSKADLTAPGGESDEYNEAEDGFRATLDKKVFVGPAGLTVEFTYDKMSDDGRDFVPYEVVGRTAIGRFRTKDGVQMASVCELLSDEKTIKYKMVSGTVAVLSCTLFCTQ